MKRKPPCRFSKHKMKGFKCRKVGRGKKSRWLCCKKKRKKGRR